MPDRERLNYPYHNEPECPEEFDESFEDLSPTLAQVPIVVLKSPPTDGPYVNEQLGPTYTAEQLGALRRLVRHAITADDVTTFARRAVTEDEADEIVSCFSELLGNAQRHNNPNVFRKATGCYIWLEWLEVTNKKWLGLKQEKTGEKVPILLVGAGDNDSRIVVDDGRDHGRTDEATAGRGLDMVCSLAHAVLVRPVPLEKAEKRAPGMDTKKIYQAAFVLGPLALSREEQMAMANSYVKSLAPRPFSGEWLRELFTGTPTTIDPLVQ